VLVPADAPGVEIGRRHDPMGSAFPNGPTTGRDVVLPADEIIGGAAYAGRGWQMLMEALSSGRAVALPAQSAAGAKMVARGVGAYAAVREQFGLSIGRFEGIQEPLARIAGSAYLMEAARVYTCGAVDGGHKPSVISAVVKYQQTELMRKAITDGLDVMGGAGLCRGPRNLIASGYIGAPIGITVEGANILTRTLIVYGQGAIRCHPYAQREIRALAEGDGGAFLTALARHGLFFVRNILRAGVLSLSRGALASSPVGGPTARYVRRLAWASASFAVLSDLAMLTFGSRLKQKGKLTGRFADLLSWMYLGVATLRRYEAEGRLAEDLPLVRWALEHALHQIQIAFDGILGNFDAPVIGVFLRGPVALWSRLNPIGTPPSDRLGSQVARIVTAPGAQRDRLTSGLFWPRDAKEAAGRLETAFGLVAQAAPIHGRIREAVRAGKLPKSGPDGLADEALAAGIIDAEDAVILRVAAAAREDAIQVDSFPPEPFFRAAASLAEEERVGASR
jgi:acyl-CoA dehydrogenase